LLSNRGDADLQIEPHLLHCAWIVKRDGQTEPIAIARQRVTVKMLSQGRRRGALRVPVALMTPAEFER